MTIYQIATQSFSTADGLAMLDFQYPGKIVGINWSITGKTASGSNAIVMQQLSFGSSNVFETNDARQVIANAFAFSDALVAATKMTFGLNHHIPMDLQINDNERIFLHQDISLGLATPDSVETLILLYVEDKANRSRFVR